MPRRPSVPVGPLLAFVVLVIAAFALFQIGDVGLAAAGTQPVTETNESVVIDYDSSTRVSAAMSRYTQGFEDNETVYNSSGAELVEGTDYTWNTTSGAVTFKNTANTTEGNTANVTYTYQQNTEEIRQSEPGVRALIEAVGGPIVFAPLITFAGLILIGLAYYATRAIRGGQRYGGR